MKIRPCSTCSDSPPAGSMSSVRNSTCSEQKRQHSSLWNAFGTTWINAVPMQVYWQVSLDNIPIYLEKKLTWTGKNGNNFHIKKVFFLVIIFKKHVLIQYWHMSPFVHATKNEKKTRTCHGVHGKNHWVRPHQRIQSQDLSAIGINSLRSDGSDVLCFKAQNLAGNFIRNEEMKQ